METGGKEGSFLIGLWEESIKCYAGRGLSLVLLAGSEGRAGSKEGREIGAGPGHKQYRLDMPDASRQKPQDMGTNWKDGSRCGGHGRTWHWMEMVPEKVMKPRDLTQQMMTTEHGPLGGEARATDLRTSAGLLPASQSS